MKLIDMYNSAVEKGKKADLRSAKVITDALNEKKKKYKELSAFEKKYFDQDSLTNPYSDSKFLYGKKDTDVKTVMVGIDIDVQELLLADRLREKGTPIDLVISHHPVGRAFAKLDNVMALQSSLWEGQGFDADMAKKMINERMVQVERGIISKNHNRVVDAAKLLEIPLLSLHTVADNCVVRYLQNIFDKQKPKKLKNILSILLKEPEYRNYYKKTGIMPQILSGKENDAAGKIFVDMTGGTNGPDRIFSRLSQVGVKTVVGMHIGESGLKTVKSEFLNYVVAGHISSDNLGLNLLFDHIDKNNRLNFVCCSGFERVHR